MFFSVVVPVYNVQKYLAECLDSILTQNAVQMEVICVNDGSTDSSLKILQEYAEKDSRIVVIDKPNSGYGDSVNIGLNKATGDYVGIVESDDMAIEGMFQKMLSIAQKNKADVVKGLYNCFTAHTGERILYQNFKNLPCERIISVDECPELFFTAPAVWSAIYKRSFLDENGIRFLPTPGASYQDTSFAFKVWALAKSVYLLSEPVIDYRQDNTASSSSLSKKVFNIFNETAEMRRFLEEKKLDRFFPEFVRAKFVSYDWTLLRLDECGKQKFFIRWIPELREDFEKGYLVKKYWDNDNWYYIHQLIFNAPKMIQAVCSCQPGEFPNYDISMSYSQVSPIYVYGAGKYAVKKFYELAQLNIQVSAFVVTHMDENPDSLNGLPVIALEKADKDGLIFIGVSDKRKSEIIQILREKWLLNNVFEI